MNRWLINRQMRNAAITLLLMLAMVIAERTVQASLRESGYFTGWSLLAVLFLLTLFNVRKRMAVIPLGFMHTWLQVHMQVGFLGMLLFFLHVHLGWRLPEGILETLLGIVYWIVMMSGIFGAYISRSFPRRLTRRGEEVFFERIACLRAELHHKAEILVLASVTETESTTIADYYSSHLYDFFIAPRHHLQHLFESNQAQFIRNHEMRSLERYLNRREQEMLDQLALLVQKKDDLDYHYTLQGMLKLWLFVHIPLTYALWVLLALHMLAVYGFLNVPL